MAVGATKYQWGGKMGKNNVVVILEQQTDQHRSDLVGVYSSVKNAEDALYRHHGITGGCRYTIGEVAVDDDMQNPSWPTLVRAYDLRLDKRERTNGKD